MAHARLALSSLAVVATILLWSRPGEAAGSGGAGDGSDAGVVSIATASASVTSSEADGTRRMPATRTPAAPAPRVATGTSAAQPKSRTTVTYRSEAVLYLADTPGSPAGQERARRVSSALAGALEARSPAVERARPVEIATIETGTVTVRIRGYPVVELHRDDARAAGYSTLEDYGRAAQIGLDVFVADQLRRQALQGLALSVLLAVMIAVGTLTAIRVLARLFDRAEEATYERRELVKPLTLFRVPIVSRETMGAALTLGLALGRAAAYLATATAGVSLILAQFEATRGWVHGALGWASQAFVSGVQRSGRAVPGLLVAVVLLLALRESLRIVGRFLRSILRARTAWRGVTPERIPVLRVVLPLILLLGTSPLIVGAAFSRFHTPLEILVLLVAAGILLACVPLVAAAAVGLLVLWRGNVVPGQWISSGRVRGTVVRVSPWEVVVADPDGVQVAVPMLSTLVRPIRSASVAPRAVVDLTVERRGGLRETVEAVTRAVGQARQVAQSGQVGQEVVVRCRRFAGTRVELRLEFMDGAARAEPALLLALEEGLVREGLLVVEAALGGATGRSTS